MMNVLIQRLRRKLGQPTANPDNIQLLEKSFFPQEWDYLSHNPTFRHLLSGKNKTLEDFDCLLEAADLLLRQRTDFCGEPQYYFGHLSFGF